MPKMVVNLITSHQITWMDTEFGWITLLNEAKPGGFVYLVPDSQPLEIPSLSADGTYIVFSIHLSHLAVMLSILKNEVPLQVRFFDPQSAGVPPSAFIEATANASGGIESRTLIEAFMKIREH
jgi:hypothetical protein